MENKKILKTAAIICEYNPFHNGHKYQIEYIKDKLKPDYMIGIMSGCFVERAEGALFSKITRARISLENGLDAVIELPFPIASASARDFANGAVRLIKDIGCVTHLCFSAEDTETEKLTAIAKYTLSDEYNQNMQRELDRGGSYAATRERVIKKELGGIGDILSKSNNILALEYITSLIKNKCNIEPYIIQRIGAGHDSDETCGNIASAGMIRNEFCSSKEIFKYMPENGREQLKDDIKNGMVFDYQKYNFLLLNHMYTLKKSDFNKNPFISEGIENRIISASMKYKSLDEMLRYCNTKRYPYARIKRILMANITSYTKYYHGKKAPYIRPLAFRDNGVMRVIKKNAHIPILSKSADVSKLGVKAQKFMQLEDNANNIWSSCLQNPAGKGINFTDKIISQ